MKNKFPNFSKEHRDALTEHKTICKKWRKAGSTQEKSHPAKANKLASQRRHQKLRRQSASAVKRAWHNDLMDTFS